jgi:hypothetical protein
MWDLSFLLLFVGKDYLYKYLLKPLIEEMLKASLILAEGAVSRVPNFTGRKYIL